MNAQSTFMVATCIVSTIGGTNTLRLEWLRNVYHHVWASARMHSCTITIRVGSDAVIIITTRNTVHPLSKWLHMPKLHVHQATY